MIEFNYLRLHNTVLKRYKESRFFMGLGYHFDYHYKINDQLLNLDNVPPVVTSHDGYSVYKEINPEKYTLSGFSLNFLFDSRDNVVNPYSGRYAFANIRMNPSF